MKKEILSFREQVAALVGDASTRRIDANGYMHVGPSNLTKAAVNDYYGREIPDYDRLGLQPLKLYKVYRPADELKKAASLYGGLPILRKHIADSAAEPLKNLRVGSTRSAEYVEENGEAYIKAPLDFHDASAIELIELGDEDALSAGYAYTPIIESGIFKGQAYDIRMTDIRPNHIIICEAGRAGSDIMVADKAINKGETGMSTKSTLLDKALAAFFKGKKPEAISKLVGDEELTPEEAAEIEREIKRKEAEAEAIAARADDEEEFEEKKKEVVRTFDDANEELRELVGVHGEEGDKIIELVEELLELRGEEIRVERTTEEVEGRDEEREVVKTEKKEERMTGDKNKRRPSMAGDSRKVAREEMAKFKNEMKEKVAAADAVRGVVGKVDSFAFDSADSIYKVALEEMGINVKSYAPSSYKAMFDTAMMTKNQNEEDARRSMAFDSTDTESTPILKSLEVDFSRFGKI